MTERDRIVIVGGGHNGLVCAAYLARAGRPVLLLEAGAELGGAARTHEFHPGFRVSSVAHLLYGLDAGIVRDLGLAAHGYALARDGLRTVALSAGAAPFEIAANGSLAGDLAGAAIGSADVAALPMLVAKLRRYAALLGRQHERAPPRLAFDDWRAALPAAQLGLDLRRMGRDDMAEFLRVVTMNIQDVLDEELASDALKAALALDGILGTKLGPRSGGTLFALLQRWSALPEQGPALPRGGMGSVSAALAAAARAAGAELRSGARVAAIEVEQGRVRGVRLEDGTQVAASAVVSNADPKTTLLCLLGARHLETEFARRVHHLRMTGTAAKLHLALSAAPAFRGLAPALAGERLVIAPGLRALDEAFNAAKYREHSREPVMEITVPSQHDATLAPHGQHVLSAIVQYAPYDIDGGWDVRRAGFEQVVLDQLEQHAPGLRASVLASELLTPLDLERRFHLGGGHWHHGELALDQALMLRPVSGAAQYAMPVPGLWLCGAGAHPGGGVLGHAGRNAARALLAHSGSTP
jgi:phytoene dehydrogenase-like protein